MPYRTRVIDETLDELFPHLAAIALEGAKGVGKTATASQRAATILNLTRPAQRELLAADEDYVTKVPSPVLIDEWQLAPYVWDRVRTAVDDDSAGGRFLLAGSATVPGDARVHSGAGRIVSLRMRPLSFVERGLMEPSVSLRELLAGDRPDITGRSGFGLSDYTDEILRSGFPGIRHLPERARDIQLDSYLSRIVEREMPENGISIRRPSALRAWLAAYGAAVSSDASYSKILDAATPGDDEKPARATVDAYREHLTRLFILDPIPAWAPAFNPLKRLTLAPKHQLVDPALAARLVRVGRDGLLRGEGVHVAAGVGSWLGALFESSVAQSVRVYADATEATTSHLRTRDTTHEVDLIVEGRDRRIVAVEVKLAASVSDKDVRHLNWIEDQLGDQVADKVLVTTGEYAYRRPDGVAVVPFALLGP